MCRRKANSKHAVLYLALSFSAFVVGFGLVLVLMKYIVVPVLDARAIHSTRCKIHQLIIKDYNKTIDISNISVSENHTWRDTSENETNIIHEEKNMCVNVQVQFRIPGHSNTLGYLYKNSKIKVKKSETARNVSI